MHFVVIGGTATAEQGKHFQKIGWETVVRWSAPSCLFLQFSAKRHVKVTIYDFFSVTLQSIKRKGHEIV